MATVVDGGRAIVDINIEPGRNKLIYHLLYNFILNPSMAASSNPFQRGSWGGVCASMETMTLEGKTAHHGGDVCVMCVLLAKSLPSGSFLYPPEHT